MVYFGFCWRDVSDGFQQSAVVEPVDPFEGGIFDGLEVAPRPATVNDLGLEQAVDRFRQGVEAPIFVKPRFQLFWACRAGCRFHG